MFSPTSVFEAHFFEPQLHLSFETTPRKTRSKLSAGHLLSSRIDQTRFAMLATGTWSGSSALGTVMDITRKSGSRLIALPILAPVVIPVLYVLSVGPVNY